MSPPSCLRLRSPSSEDNRAPAWNAEANWSPDGSFIVLSVAESRTEWKLLEGLTTDGVMKVLAGRGK